MFKLIISLIFYCYFHSSNFQHKSHIVDIVHLTIITDMATCLYINYKQLSAFVLIYIAIIEIRDVTRTEEKQKFD